MPDGVSFGLFADAHYAKDLTYGNRYCVESLGKLRSCAATFNERKLPFAVNLGDLIDHRGESEFEVECLQKIYAEFAGFRGDRYTVLGNHDTSCLPKDMLLAQVGEGRPDHYAFDHSGYHFVVLDSNCHADGSDYAPQTMPKDWGDAWVSRAQLDWLTDDLASAHGAPTVVFCHANLDYREWNGGRDPHVLRNHAEIRSLLEGAGHVVAVIQGHCHNGRQDVVNGIPYVTIPGMVEGSGPGNNAYAIASLDTDGKLTVEGFGRIAGAWYPQ